MCSILIKKKSNQGKNIVVNFYFFKYCIIFDELKYACVFTKLLSREFEKVITISMPLWISKRMLLLILSLFKFYP